MVSTVTNHGQASVGEMTGAPTKWKDVIHKEKNVVKNNF